MTSQRWHFVVEGRPIAQRRMTTRTADYMGDHPVWAWRELIGREAKTAGVRVAPADAEVALSIRFYQRSDPAKRPDLENLVKSVKDALADIAYDNDTQVSELHAHKYRVEPGDNERAEIHISWV